MDWGRAKTILIATFLLLNLMLGFELWVNRTGLSGSGSQSDAVLGEIKQILAIKGIAMQAEIPKEMPNLKKYVVKLEEAVGRGEAEINPPIKIAGPVTSDKLKSAVGNVIPRLDDYVLDPLAEQKGIYVLSQVLAAYPVFGVELRLYQRGDELYRYNQQYVQSISEVDPEQPMLSAAVAFRRLLERDDVQGPATVKEIKLGLSYRPIDNSDGLAVPTWRVAIETGGESTLRWFYIDAFSGEVSEGLKPASEAAE